MMIFSSQPRPTLAGLDASHLTDIQAETRGNFVLSYDALKGNDLAGAGFRDLCRDAAFPTAMCAVDKPIGLIFLRRLPLQMPRVNAAKVAFAAIMRCLMPWSWRRPIDRFACKAMDILQTAIRPNLTTAVYSLAVRPIQALFALVGEDYFTEVAPCLSLASAALKRVAILAETPVVHVAITARNDRSAAIIDATYAVHISAPHKSGLRKIRQPVPSLILDSRFPAKPSKTLSDAGCQPGAIAEYGSTDRQRRVANADGLVPKDE